MGSGSSKGVFWLFFSEQSRPTHDGGTLMSCGEDVMVGKITKFGAVSAWSACLGPAAGAARCLCRAARPIGV